MYLYLPNEICLFERFLVEEFGVVVILLEKEERMEPDNRHVRKFAKYSQFFVVYIYNYTHDEKYFK